MTRALCCVALLSTSAAFGCHYARGIGFVRDDLPRGRPPFAAGTAEGYWIWQDAEGWHVRTTSDAPRHFYGTVETLGGDATAVRAVGRAAGSVRADGSTILFDYRASGGEQGFDWPAAPRCNRFELYIDGTTRPLRVFLGGVEQSPARIPFAVCS